MLLLHAPNSERPSEEANLSGDRLSLVDGTVKLHERGGLARPDIFAGRRNVRPLNLKEA